MGGDQILCAVQAVAEEADVRGLLSQVVVAFAITMLSVFIFYYCCCWKDTAVKLLTLQSGNFWYKSNRSGNQLVPRGEAHNLALGTLALAGDDGDDDDDDDLTR